MPRYKPPKITRYEAADEFNAAYDRGYAKGVSGSRPLPDHPWSIRAHISEWDLILRERENDGRQAGFAEFCRRVRAIKCDELPPPYVGPPPKITFDPGYMNGRG